MQLFYWIKESKEKPPIKSGSTQDSEEVVVCLSTGEVYLDTYSHRYDLWMAWGKKVTHWGFKPIPADGENE
jgi:hypothetical protein